MAGADYSGHVYKNLKVIQDRPLDVSVNLGGTVVLGSGPVYVVLDRYHVFIHYKDNCLYKFSPPTFPFEDFSELHGCQRIFETHFSIEKENNLFQVSLVWGDFEDDSEYVFAELRERENIWHGFSGYGVGYGLEEHEYKMFDESDLKEGEKMRYYSTLKVFGYMMEIFDSAWSNS